jgi:hypothetical protein
VILNHNPYVDGLRCCSTIGVRLQESDETTRLTQVSEELQHSCGGDDDPYKFTGGILIPFSL